MKLILFGANGGLGQWVWKTAIDAGHQVVAFVRTPSKLDQADPRFPQLTVVQGNALDADAIQAAAAGCDVAINCTSPAGGDATIDLARSVVSNAAAAGVGQFYMIGGMGALWAPGTDRTVLLQDWDDADAMEAHGMRATIPRAVIQRMTRGHLASMAYLENTGLPHTYLCPGAMFDGPPSDTRVVTLDELGGRSPGRVSFGNIARVIVDDLGHGRLLGHRVCVSQS